MGSDPIFLECGIRIRFYSWIGSGESSSGSATMARAGLVKTMLLNLILLDGTSKTLRTCVISNLTLLSM